MLIDLTNEYQVLAFTIDKGNADAIDNKLFLSPVSKKIHNAIRKIQEQHLEYTPTTLVSVIDDPGNDYSESVHTIEGYRNSSFNYDFHVNKLKQDYQKKVVSAEKLQKLIEKVLGYDSIDTEDAKAILSEFERGLEISDLPKLKSFTELIDEYENVLLEREDPDSVRSYGIKTIDKLMRRPAAPGELSVLAAQSGHGKTMFKQVMQLGAVTKSIPVLQFTLEMSEESNLDRLIAMCRGNAKTVPTTEDLHHLNIFKTRPNFLSCDEPYLSLSKIDQLLYEAKEIFRSRGVIKDDDYILYTIDLLDQVQDFENGTPTDIKKAVDEWHRINKKHRCHGLGIVQLNENRLRGREFKTDEDVENYTPRIDDLYGGGAYRQRARNIFLIHRPKEFKRAVRPDLYNENEPDFIRFYIAKQSDGVQAQANFIFDSDRLLIRPYVGEFA